MTPAEMLSSIANHFAETQALSSCRPFRKVGKCAIWNLSEIYVCVCFRRSKWASDNKFNFYSDLSIGSRVVYEFRKQYISRLHPCGVHQFLSHISEGGRSGQGEWSTGQEWVDAEEVGRISSRFDDIFEGKYASYFSNAGLLDLLLKDSIWPNAPLPRIVDVGIIALEIRNHFAAEKVLERIYRIDLMDSDEERIVPQLVDELRAMVRS